MQPDGTPGGSAVPEPSAFISRVSPKGNSARLARFVSAVGLTVPFGHAIGGLPTPTLPIDQNFSPSGCSPNSPRERDATRSQNQELSRGRRNLNSSLGGNAW
jgi:hypothetical protein